MCALIAKKPMLADVVESVKRNFPTRAEKRPLQGVITATLDWQPPAIPTTVTLLGRVTRRRTAA
jgi:hypothetical protein